MEGGEKEELGKDPTNLKTIEWFKVQPNVLEYILWKCARCL